MHIQMSDRSDFVDDFGGPATPAAISHGHAFLSAYGLVILFLVVGLLIVVAVLAYRMALSRARRKLSEDCERSINYIYDAIKFHIDQAVATGGTGIIEKSKEVVDIIELRLGHVLRLDKDYGGPIRELKKACDEAAKPEGTPPPSKPKDDTVKRALPTDEQHRQVWEALHGLRVLWDDRTTIHGLLKQAQSDLLWSEVKARQDVETRRKPYPTPAKAANPQKTRPARQSPPPPPDLPPSPPSDEGGDPPPPPPRKKWKGGKKPGLA